MNLDTKIPAPDEPRLGASGRREGLLALWLDGLDAGANRRKQARELYLDPAQMAMASCAPHGL